MTALFKIADLALIRSGDLLRVLSLKGLGSEVKINTTPLTRVLDKVPWSKAQEVFTTRIVLLGLAGVVLAFILVYLPDYLRRLKLQKGEKRFAQKDYAAAREIFAELVEKYPRYYQAYVKLASSYRSLKEYEKAIEVYKAALKIKPGSIELAKCIEILQTEANQATQLASPPEEKAAQTPPVSQKKATSSAEKPSRYVIQQEIGEGGMGTIYRAIDTVLDRTVALKVLSKSLSRNRRALQRFLREAQSAGKLNHPNIVNIYDVGKESKNLFIAMEFIDGDNLYDILQEKGVFSLRKAIEYTMQVCDGMAEAHKSGIVHRDLKPENIMVDRYGKIKIMDFGVAHIENKGMTRTGAKIGTPLYMSPEQIRGEVVDIRSDVYSLGIVLYELLTGGPPFLEGDIAYMHLHKRPEPPTSKNPALPDAIDVICLKAIEKEREDRYQTMQELGAALENIHQAATEVIETPLDADGPEAGSAEEAELTALARREKIKPTIIG